MQLPRAGARRRGCTARRGRGRGRVRRAARTARPAHGRTRRRQQVRARPGPAAQQGRRQPGGPGLAVEALPGRGGPVACSQTPPRLHTPAAGAACLCSARAARLSTLVLGGRACTSLALHDTEWRLCRRPGLFCWSRCSLLLAKQVPAWLSHARAQPLDRCVRMQAVCGRPAGRAGARAGLRARRGRRHRQGARGPGGRAAR